MTDSINIVHSYSRDKSYVYVIEKTDTGYSAHFIFYPGCVATGSTLEEVKANLGMALYMHLEELRNEQ